MIIIMWGARSRPGPSVVVLYASIGLLCRILRWFCGAGGPAASRPLAAGPGTGIE